MVFAHYLTDKLWVSHMSHLVHMAWYMSYDCFGGVVELTKGYESPGLGL